MKRFRPNIYKNLILILLILGSLYLINRGLEVINDVTSENNEEVQIGSSFSLIDQFNNEFNSIDNKNYKLIYFGYTFCPDVCPVDLLNVSRVFENNKNLTSNIIPIFISLDPIRDSPSIIKDYLSNFDKNIIGLTGTEEQIKKILKNFKIYKKNHKSSSTDMDYLIDHTSLFYLINEHDKYITHFSRKSFKNDFLKFLKSL